MKQVFLLFTLIIFAASSAFAGTISGKVTAKSSGEALMGANVYLKGTTIGAATDEDGMYYIKVDDGTYNLVCDYVGYSVEQVKVIVSGDLKMDFQLTEYLFAKTINVIADRAKERETPVAFSNVEKEAMEIRLGSRDIPLVLNTTPSVYATQQGGGAGDARVNVRGFNQRNVAIMINGVPVNDMENGWVYWSNWDGVGDATSSIQVQRGLSAINLATPSIGGTMNILTDPTAMNAGVKFKQEYGSGMFLKSSLIAHSGLIANKFAVSGAIVRKIGDGLIDKTWTDAWAYYFGASYNINENNRIELYALGAPQRHGQNLYKQNIATYDQKFARSLDDYDQAAFAQNGGEFVEVGREFNQNWAPVSSSYTGKQNWNEASAARYNKKFINERENFFHKPQVNLNWYSNITNDLALYTVLYYSGGHGGGTGGYGKLLSKDANGKVGGQYYKFYYGPSPWTRDWDGQIDINSAAAGKYYVDKYGMEKADGQSIGILRNSRNNQWTIGGIIKTVYKVNNNLKTTIGIDVRTAEIEHYREVRDLLGGTYFTTRDPNGDPYMYYGEPLFQESDFWQGDDFKLGLGDKVDYNFTNTVDWGGAFAQAEYTKDRLSTYGMFGYSTIKYSYTNHFKKAEGSDKELTQESDMIGGFQIKGGVAYRSSMETTVFANLGYVSKVPIFDDVIDDYSGVKNDNVKNSTFTSFEFGINYNTLKRDLVIKADVYYTKWNNRTLKNTEFDFEGSDFLVFLKGVNAEHYGLEMELAYQPSSLWRLDGALSLGHWTYTKDVDGEARYWETGKRIPYRFYIRDLRVGDAPQTQAAISGSFFPIKGMQAQIVYKYYAQYYADFNPFDRTNINDRTQSWKVPAYGLMDFHFMYNLPFSLSGVKLQLFAHLYNALDEIYIQDAVDNSKYNAWDKDHDADDAEVFLGLPRFFNVGLSINY